MTDTTKKAVERLADRIEVLDGWNGHRSADLIRDLLAERDKLREALSLIAVVGFSDDPEVNAAIAQQTVSQARAALSPTPDAKQTAATSLAP